LRSFEFRHQVRAFDGREALHGRRSRLGFEIVATPGEQSERQEN
jgi:hypothetical protein